MDSGHKQPENINILISVNKEYSPYSSVHIDTALNQFVTKNKDKIIYGKHILDYIKNGLPNVKGEDKTSVKDHENHINKLVKAYLANHCNGLVIPGNSYDIDRAFYSGNTARIHKIDLNLDINRRTKIELALVKEAFAQGIPVLGICGGNQVINVALGGKIKNVDADDDDVVYLSDTQLHGIIQSKDKVTTDIVHEEKSLHTQAIVEEYLPPELQISAKDSDGIIKAVEMKGHHPWVIGTQFHPEDKFEPRKSIGDPQNIALFTKFITACRIVKETKKNKKILLKEFKQKYSDQVTNNNSLTVTHEENLRLNETELSHLLNAINKEDIETLKKIYTNPNISDDKGRTPLYLAVQAGKLNVIKYLLSLPNIDPNICDDNECQSPLHIAAAAGRSDIINLMLKNHKVDPNISDDIGRTPLLLAAEAGKTKSMKTLLDSMKVNRHLVDNDDKTVMYYAINSQNNEAIKLLMNAGFDLDSKMFQELCRNGNIDTIRVFQESISKFDDDTINFGVAIAIGNNQREIVNYFFNNGLVNPNVKFQLHFPSSDRQSLLAFAVQQKKLEMIELLLLKGAKVNDTLSRGEPLLYIASLRGDIETVKILLKYNVDTTQLYQNASSLFIAAEKGHTDVVLALHAKNKTLINQECNGHTPLGIAIRMGNYETVKVLLKNGADLNDKKSFAIGFALFYKDKELLEILLENKNKFNQENKLLLAEAEIQFQLNDLAEEIKSTDKFTFNTFSNGVDGIRYTSDNDEIEYKVYQINIPNISDTMMKKIKDYLESYIKLVDLENDTDGSIPILCDLKQDGKNVRIEIGYPYFPEFNDDIAHRHYVRDFISTLNTAMSKTLSVDNKETLLSKSTNSMWHQPRTASDKAETTEDKIERKGPGNYQNS